MMCKKCKEEPVAKGIKKIVCIKCMKETIVNCAHGNICSDCSDKLQICEKCGTKMYETIENNNKYKVVTLCGSTKFKDDFIKIQEELTLEGNIVISVGLFGHADNKYDSILTDEVKEMLDDMHKRKIDMADEIFVINKNGYIGNSTRSEIEYAAKTNKKINYMYNE